MYLRLRFLILGLLVCCAVTAQQISVKSFRKLEGDLTARVTAPKTDQNGDKCAIIKVVTGEAGFVFEPDGLGITDRVKKTGEIWLYVPYGAKRLTIKHDKLGVLRNYMYGEVIEKACVYELVLTTGRVITMVEEVPTEQWLVITTEPKNAVVYVDDIYEAGTDGNMQKYVKCGKYNYRVTAPLYHTEAGIVEVTPDKKAKLSIQLKPAFGYLAVNSLPESGARVWIDGEEAGETPYKSDKLKSGKHRVQVLKMMYQPVEEVAQIVDGETTTVSLDMSANFAAMTLVTDTASQIWVDGRRQGTGQWNGRLNAGIHAVEIRKENHRTVKHSLEVLAGETKTITLASPSPLYGILNISSSPSEAAIFLNGKAYGETPQVVRDVLIGSYELKLSKAGCATDIRTITVEEGKTLPVSAALSQGESIWLKTLPEGGMLWVDGRSLGKSPQQLELSYGMHSVKGEADGKTVENSFEVKQKGGDREVVLRFEIPCGEVFFDDRDGQKYPTIQLGKQCWMTKNLNYGTFTKIITGGGNGESTYTFDDWGIQKWCYNDNVSNCTTYGGLYEWWEVICGGYCRDKVTPAEAQSLDLNSESELSAYGARMVSGSRTRIQGICPDGWHVPRDAEWKTLGKAVSGWNVQLGGGRSSNGNGFHNLGTNGRWWSSTPSDTCAWYRNLGSTGVGTGFSRGSYVRSYGFSVRCLRN